MIASWASFCILAAVVFLAGWRLTVCADRIAETYRLSRSWVGVTLVGFITSLPELIASTSAAGLVKVPDMAVGNVFGSVMFNLAILAGCDLALRKEGGIIRRVSQQHVISSAFGIMLAAVLLLGLVFPAGLGWGPFHFGLGSLAAILGCLGGYYVLFRFNVVGRVPGGETGGRGKGGMLLLRFAFYSLAVVLSAIALAKVGDRAARASGISHTFFGSLFLAAVTSLPELVVSMTALKLGAWDLLVGNILGSNMINVSIVAFADIAYLPAAFRIPANVGWGQVFTGLMGIVAASVVIVGLMHGQEGARPIVRRGKIGLESVVLLLLYMVCMAGLYLGWGRG